MPAIQMSIEVPEYTDEELRHAVLEACVDRILGAYSEEKWEQQYSPSGLGDPVSLGRAKRDGAFIAALRKQAQDLVLAKTREVVEARTVLVVDEVLAGRFTPVDRFGDRQPETSLREVIAKAVTDYMNGEVDQSGQPIRGYHNGPKWTRFHWLIQKAVEDVFAKELRSRVDQIVVEVKQGLSGKVSAKISETVLALLALPKAPGT